MVWEPGKFAFPEGYIIQVYHLETENVYFSSKCKQFLFLYIWKFCQCVLFCYGLSFFVCIFLYINRHSLTDSALELKASHRYTPSMAYKNTILCSENCELFKWTSTKWLPVRYTRVERFWKEKMLFIFILFSLHFLCGGPEGNSSIKNN